MATSRFQESEIVSQLIGAKDYRSFLKIAFKYLEEKDSRFSFASFSRNAGLNSRSFPRDVLLKRKRLTFSSTEGFSRALGLKGDLEALFKLLVAQEEKDLRTPKDTQDQIKKKIEKARSRMNLKQQGDQSERSEGMLKHPQWMEVYSAMGTEQDGASLEEICSRTRMSPKALESTLKRMFQQGILRFEEEKNRYYAQSAHLILKSPQASQVILSAFLNQLSKAKVAAERNFHAEDKLFYYSAFSVRRQDMPALKEKLRSVLRQFHDESEVPTGDGVAKLGVAFLE
jgi:uncharacterized protein (TIGR02147 family)